MYPLDHHSAASSLLHLFIGITLLAVSISICGAQQLGDLLVAPTRVVFEGPKQNETLSLTNTGHDTATYQISFVHMRMSAEGRLTATPPGDSVRNSADDYIRVFPRKIVLAPNETQNVRVQLINKNQLPSGEFRTHLYFRGIPVSRFGAAKHTDPDSGISVHITPVYGISLPIIVRHGVLSATVQLDSFSSVPDSITPFDSLGNKRTIASINFLRSGEKSVYGGVIVNFRGVDGNQQQIGVLKGVAIYPPLESRMAFIHLTLPAELLRENGFFIVDYYEYCDTKKGLIAHGEFPSNR